MVKVSVVNHEYKMSQINNARIAKNTIMLYVRMLVIMAVSLYTSRVILQVIGVNDYGVYNLVAGFVTIFSFISNALISATQRYFNVALGSNNKQYYKDIYSASINVMLLFSVIIFVLGETLGLWFVRTQLNIAEDRMLAAEWVFHISLLTFVANLLRTTFNASVIAHERMSFYAYVSIFEAAARLGIVFLLQSVSSDKLVAYAWLYFTVSVAMVVINAIYCHKTFDECKYSFRMKLGTFKELIKFSSWTLLGQSAVVVRNQGEAILINRFFSVVANAALGVANQVTGALDMFVTNFQTAFNPQIVKTYASGELQQHHMLVCRASKLSYYLLLILSLPILFNINTILGWWLVEVPYQANYFCSFISLSHLINALGTPFNTSILATGHIKRYQILCSLIFISGLMLSALCLWFNGPSYSIVIVGIFVQLLLFINRICHAIQLTKLSFKHYLRTVITPLIVITLLYFPVIFLTSIYATSIIGVFIAVIIDILYAVVLIYFLGTDSSEKQYARQIIGNVHRKLFIK